MGTLVITFTTLLALAMLCQWLAWRTHLPALVLLSAMGIVLGPVSGVLDPYHALGDFLPQLVSLSVAVILFDGGLSLDFKELRETRRAVKNMVYIGAPLSWLLISLAAHYIAGLSWPVSVLFGGILVVTGPTVIIPMMRQARLNMRVGSVLKWEGIVNDPIGALFAVIAYEFIVSPHMQNNPLGGFLTITLNIALIGIFSFLAARLVAFLFRKGSVPEFLKAPILLTATLAAYVIGNAIQHEGGLIAVTVLGATLAASHLPSVEDLRKFKEAISIVLVSLLFIVLTATLQWSDVYAMDLRTAAFLLVLLFVVRPLSVWMSCLGTQLTNKEKLFVGWIAPRGIVCVAVTGLFGPLLVKAGYPDGAQLVPLSFAVVFATILFHGFSIGPLGRKLGLVAKQSNGVLIAGANRWCRALALALKEKDIPVMLISNNWHRLKEARLLNIPVHYGEILSETTDHHLEYNQYRYLVAATDNFAYNSLVASRFAHEFGRDKIYQLPGDQDDHTDPKAFSHTVRGISLFGEGGDYESLIKYMAQGWEFTSTRISEDFTFEDFTRRYQGAFLPILTIRDTGELFFYTPREDFVAKPGDTILLMAQEAAQMNQEKAEKKAAEASAK